MYTMNRDMLQSILQTIECRAQKALAGDATFLEALPALNSALEDDLREQAAGHKLGYRRVSGFSSFAPHITIRARAGETSLTPSEHAGRAVQADTEIAARMCASDTGSMREHLCDVINAFIADGSLCREVKIIISEIVHADAVLRRLASAVERAGYRLLICIDLSMNADVREQYPAHLRSESHNTKYARARHAEPSDARISLQLSDVDIHFLNALRIRHE